MAGMPANRGCPATRHPTPAPVPSLPLRQVSAVVPLLRWLTTARVLFYCHFPDLLLAARRSALHSAYRAPLDWVEQESTGAADAVLVNSGFTQGGLAGLGWWGARCPALLAAALCSAGRHAGMLPCPGRAQVVACPLAGARMPRSSKPPAIRRLTAFCLSEQAVESLPSALCDAGVFAETFTRLHRRGIRPAVLYPAGRAPALFRKQAQARHHTEAVHCAHAASFHFHSLRLCLPPFPP